MHVLLVVHAVGVLPVLGLSLWLLSKTQLSWPAVWCLSIALALLWSPALGLVLVLAPLLWFFQRDSPLSDSPWDHVCDFFWHFGGIFSSLWCMIGDAWDRALDKVPSWS